MNCHPSIAQIPYKKNPGHTLDSPRSIVEFIQTLPADSLSQGKADAVQFTFEAGGSRLDLLPMMFEALESSQTLQRAGSAEFAVHLLIDANKNSAVPNQCGGASLSSYRIVISLSSTTISNYFAQSSGTALYGLTALSEAFAVANRLSAQRWSRSKTYQLCRSEKNVDKEIICEMEENFGPLHCSFRAGLKYYRFEEHKIVQCIIRKGWTSIRLFWPTIRR